MRAATAPRRPTLPRAAELAIAVALTIAFTALASHFPLSGDDWAWGSQIGLDRLAARFTNYNGRYAGNLAVLGLTRAGPALPVVMGVTVVAIIVLVLDLSDNRTVAGYLTTFALVLGIPIEVWRQSIVWTSGFSNYALATLFLLIVLRSIKWDAAATPAGRPWPRLLLVGVTGFVAQLFIEHVTIYLLISGATYVVVSWVRRGRPSSLSVASFVGLLSGAAVMFANGAYRRALNGQNTYQNVGGSGSRYGTPQEVLTTIISRYLVSDNSKLNIVLFALVFLLSMNLARRSAGWRRLVGVAAAVASLLAAVGLAATALVDLPPPTPNWPVVALVVVLATLLFSALLVGSAADRVALLLVTGSVLVIALPLVVVTPLGPRCFLPPYVLLLVAINILLRNVVAAWGLRWAHVWSVVMALSLAVMLTRLFDIYVRVDHASEARLAYIQHQVADGASVVVVRPLPHHNWVHVPDPSRPPWDVRYKLFHGLPPGLTIRVK